MGETFGSWLKTRRERASLTQQALAEAITASGGTATQHAVESWELGARRPRPAQFTAICDALAVDEGDRIRAAALCMGMALPERREVA